MDPYVVWLPAREPRNLFQAAGTWWRRYHKAVIQASPKPQPARLPKSEAKDLLRKSGGPLEKFGFRKIFCDLRIVYRPSVRLCVDLLLPFRRVVARLNRPAAAANIKALLAQELIQRSFS